MHKQIITLKSAYDFANRDNSQRFQNLAALQELYNPPRNRKPQAWTFLGTPADWKRCVAPYYN